LAIVAIRQAKGRVVPLMMPKDNVKEAVLIADPVHTPLPTHLPKAVETPLIAIHQNVHRTASTGCLCLQTNNCPTSEAQLVIANITNQAFASHIHRPVAVGLAPTHVASKVNA
jgi:hypothetical protein